jgi:hypothetical protein
MLRRALLVLGVFLMAAPLVLSVAAIVPAAAGAVLLLALLVERFVYKPIRTEHPGPGWNKTAERFIDPGSGLNVVVYFNPRTGERRYVAGAPVEVSG